VKYRKKSLRTPTDQLTSNIRHRRQKHKAAPAKARPLVDGTTLAAWHCYLGGSGGLDIWAVAGGVFMLIDAWGNVDLAAQPAVIAIKIAPTTKARTRFIIGCL
jgi:hypothetical protein